MNQLEQIRIFVELINSGSATRAAEKLGLANSAVSRRLKELESRLGIQLVKRTTRTMHLTDAGQQYYNRCVNILEDIEDAETEVTKSKTELSGRLSIAAPTSFGVSYLAPAVVKFMKLHPELVINVNMNDRQVDLVSEGFDLAIRIGKLEDSTLMARQLAPVSHVVCASPSYLEKHGVPQSPEDLIQHPGLCYANLKSPAQWIYYDKHGESQTVKVPIRFTASNGDALRQAAEADLGILCEPSFIVYPSIQSKRLVPILTDFQWYKMAVYAVYPQTRYLPTKTRLFIDFLANRFGENPEWERF